MTKAPPNPTNCTNPPILKIGELVNLELVVRIMLVTASLKAPYGAAWKLHMGQPEQYGW